MKVSTDRGRAAVAAGATLALAGWALGFPDLTRLGLVAVAAVLVAAVTVTRRRPDVTVDRVGPAGRLVAGEPTSLAVHVSPGRGHSPAVLVEQPLPALAGAVPSEWAPPLTAPETFTLDVNLTFPRRGVFTLPPCVITREDPFGFGRRSWTTGTPSTVVVLPRIHDLHATPPRAGGAGEGGDLTTVSGHPDPDGLAIRTYVPGDDVRRIHWPATAHRGELMTRQEEPVAPTRALMVIDPRLTRPGHQACLEWGIEFAASAAAAWDRLGIVSELAGGPLPDTRHSTPSLDDLLHGLAVLQPQGVSGLRSGRSDDESHVLLRQISAAGTVLLVAAADGGDTTTTLLRALPTGAAGLVCLVGTGSSGTCESARALGWTATAADPTADHAAIWEQLIGGGGR